MTIDETVYKGRPADERIAKEQRCYELLDSLDMEYWRVDHEHADSIEECEKVEAVLGCHICKNLLLTNRQQTDVYLLAMPGEKPFKTKILSKQIGSARLSFATAEQMLELLDITPGSVSILGLMNDKDGKVQLLVDEELKEAEFFGCHPCINTSSLKLKTTEALGKLLQAMKHEARYVSLPWVIED